jgi:hypothetical protein
MPHPQTAQQTVSDAQSPHPQNQTGQQGFQGLRNLKRPQEEHSVDEDRPVRNLSARVDPVRRSIQHAQFYQGRKCLPLSESE